MESGSSFKDGHGGNVWRLARESGNSWQTVLDFSANINPLGFPAGLKETILNYLPTITHYPDPECQALREKLAQLHRIGLENIIVGNGSTELLHLLPRALKLQQGLIIEPAFSEYEKGLRYNGTRPHFLELSEADGFQLDLAEFEEKLNGMEIVFLANPSNPTGQVWERSVLEDLLLLCYHNGAFLLVDEAFIDFLDQPERVSLTPLLNQWDNLLVLRSFTKFYAIPGLRLGYLVGNRRIIRRMRERQEPWSVNLLAQVVGQELLVDQDDFIQRSRILIKEERAFLAAELGRLDSIKIYPSQANFLLLRLTQNDLNATTLAQELVQRKLLIRDCSNFRGLNNFYFRIAVRTRPENEVLIAALKEILT
ncbi:MAG: threonine-phosphate decarboxylase [Nitrospinae bacterium RIFCSPLOWO2_12_FULL_45_22]|nr:MAG: threonine-phosphate decarboxylase [Nitrospinae bacterium RIFCSPLOWO2_12_FULL_45_22]